ncbi:hypothetical protein PVAP13_8KG265402, partial [Panicum virgatum]
LTDDESRVYHSNDVQFSTIREPDVGILDSDPYERVYNDLPSDHLVLRKVPICEYCGAIRFPSQGPGFCCRQGKNIWYFNSHFSFTSFGATMDHRVANAAGTSVYTFKVHGQIYHRLDQLRPVKDGLRHMQLYFYDTDETLSHELKIELNTTIFVGQRRYNAPTMDQVAAIWQDSSHERNKFKRSIMVYPNSGHPEFLRAYHGCYDPLAYPILYPGGETGWEDKSILLEEIPIIHFPRIRRKYTKRKNDDIMVNSFISALILLLLFKKTDGGGSRLHVSAREYYCY